MKNKYEVSAWAIVEAHNEGEARDTLDNILEQNLRTHDGFLGYGVSAVCPFYDEDEAPFCEECEE